MTIYNRFQGDPAVNITEDGAEMKFIGGQPVVDQGFENAALISLFTKKGWWGNTLFQKQSEKIGSDYEIQSSKPIVAISSINDINDAADKSLQWMKDLKIADEILIDIVNPNANNIKVNIKIIPPGRTPEELLLFKNGLNWKAQAVNPAHERF